MTTLEIEDVAVDSRPGPKVSPMTRQLADALRRMNVGQSIRICLADMPGVKKRAHSLARNAGITIRVIDDGAGYIRIGRHT